MSNFPVPKNIKSVIFEHMNDLLPFILISLAIIALAATGCTSTRLVKCENTIDNLRMELDICRANQMEELELPCDLNYH